MMHQKSKNRRKKKSNKFVLETFHLWATFLGIIIAVMSVNLLTFVQGIQVKNNENATSKDIVTWATDDALSFNGLYLWYKINHTEVEYPVSIVDAKVTFQNPWTLTIRVTEKEMLGGVVLSDSYAYFDHTGVVLSMPSQMQEGVPLVEGIGVVNSELYEPLVTKDDVGFRNLLQVMQLVEKHEVMVDDIVPGDDSSVAVIIGDITVRLGNSDFEGKVPHIAPILERLEENEGTLYLDNFDGDNGTITFK